MIQDHNSAINVYSEIDVGTSFVILLPNSKKEIKEIEVNNTIQKGSGKILLVDDEELIRATGKHILEDMGYNVILSKNGEQAIKTFKEKFSEIDVIIMDMIMPKKNGREAFYELKK